MQSSLPSQGTRIADFLRDLETELKAEGLEDLKRRLVGLEMVEQELAGIRGELQLQVLRGSGIVEEYQRSRQDEATFIDAEAPDFILRRDNVELLVDLHWAVGDKVALDRKALTRLQKLISASSKSEEVVAVWPDIELSAVSLGLDDIRKYINGLDGSESVVVEQGRIAPFSTVVRSAFGRYRVALASPGKPAEVTDTEFDAGEIFKARLEAAFATLKDSLPRRRLQERASAIQSLSASDIDVLIGLFREAIANEVDEGYLASQIEELSRGIER